MLSYGTNENVKIILTTDIRGGTGMSFPLWGKGSHNEGLNVL
jgi:hypothetical protein